MNSESTNGPREALHKFKYMGLLNGRTEWGVIEAKSRDEALSKLQSNGIVVQRLTDGSDEAGMVRPKELIQALVGDGNNLASDAEYLRWLRIMDNWDRIHQNDPRRIANDPKAQRLLTGISQVNYPDIAARAAALLAISFQPLPTQKSKWWQFWK